jgi:AMP phosphorylase
MKDELSVPAIVNTSETFVAPDEVGVFLDTAKELGIVEGDMVTVNLLPPPTSVQYIRKKMRGEKLAKEEIDYIIKDAVDRALSDIEVTAFITAEQYHGMDMDEVEALTRAMVNHGTKMDFERPVFDKHSLGGIPGNKVTLLIVPIVAAAGLLIPKTSSRAITSPSGTADTMSTLAPVDFSASELKKIVTRTNGAIIWGGSLNLAPADDIFIGVEYPLQIDPEPQMLASIMAKKLAVGTDYLVLDLPVGREAKVETPEQARSISNKIIELGERLGMKVKCGLTYGGQPVGYSVGPALEAREALLALEGRGPSSLVEKSTALAGLLFELAGKAARGRGQDMAKEILASGKALVKMREIIEAQGGNPNVRPDDLPVGEHKAEILAPFDGYITRVSNRAISAIARAAGAPMEKGAGVVFYGKEGHKMQKEEKMLEIHAERESRLEEAYQLALKLKPMTLEGMLLQEIPEL